MNSAPAAGGPRLQPEDYNQLSRLLKSWTGIHLQGKDHLMAGRLAPRLRELGLTSYRAYFQLLSDAGSRSEEGQEFINALTTNKTSFFREPHHFTFLVEEIFAEARRRAAQGAPQRLRLYSAGCSLGAEPYTMAMLAAAHLPAAHGWDVKILATDLDTEVLAAAKRAVYDQAELDSVPREMLRWFTRESAGHVRLQPEVTRLVTFGRANLIATPFPVRGSFDAIFCRNVMIYFDRATQDQLVSALLQLLVPGGAIVVGHSEALMRPELQREKVPGAYRVLSTDPAMDASAGGSGALGPSPAGPHTPSWSTPPPRARRPADPRRARPAMPAPTIKDPKLPRRTIVLGQWHVSSQPALVSTLLGSCVAACVFDPVARIGGMNHFMLPQATSPQDDSARFGVHAMEVLINDLMRAGAQRSRLQAKVFGAAAVNRALMSAVPARNEEFITGFLRDENIPLLAARLGGTSPREITMRTDTAEVRVRIVGGGTDVESLQRREAAAYKPRSSDGQPTPFSPDDVLF